MKNMEKWFRVAKQLKESDQLDEAEAAYRGIIAFNPKYFEAHHNLGTVLRMLGRFDESLAAYRNALAVNPRSVETHIAIGNVLLLTGDFEAGFREMEWRHCGGDPQLIEVDFPGVACEYQRDPVDWVSRSISAINLTTSS